MPVERFRHLDDARRALWTSVDDARLADRLRQLWRFSARLTGSSCPPGVHRFRTIEEANAARERQVTARVNTLRAARAARRGP
jgi:hypothetical protein